MDVKKVCVVGGGTMGSGIAHVFAQNGFETVLVEANAELGAKAVASIGKNMDRQVAKGTLSAADKDAALKRLTTTTSIAEAGGFQLAVEAVPEKLDIKRQVFQQLEEAGAPGAILATNTSSLPIAQIADGLKDPARVIGMHFMNPVPIMKLVEIIKSDKTSDEVCGAVVELAKRLGKVPAVARDVPGFVSNRVLMPMINEAIECLREGVATKEDIDAIMKLGMAHPMGPIQLADYIGLDVCLAIMEVLDKGFGGVKYKPSPLLREMVQQGKLGVKSGAGFYEHPKK